MATRTRSKRGAPPPPPPPPPSSRPETRSRAARSTRQTTIPASVTNSEPSQRVKRQTQPTPKRPKAPSFPMARRGARPDGRGLSIASIATVPQRPEGYSDSDEDDRISEEPQEEEHPAENQSGRELVQGEGGDVEFELEENEGGEDLAARYQVMKLSLPDLAKASDDLVTLLEEPRYDPQVFAGLHQLKLKTLEGFREIYEEPHTTPFVDWVQLINIYQSAEGAAPAAAIIARANIATVLDEIHEAQTEQEIDPSPLLQQLADFFPSFFINQWDSNQDPELTLDIRTVYLWYVLVREQPEVDPYEIIADIFCEPVDGKQSYSHRFSHGPFKKLWDGEQADGDADLLCSERIKDIITAIKNEKETHGVRQLATQFPLEDMLAKLRNWLLTMYAILKEPLNRASVDSGDAIPLDSGDDVADSQADFAESQPIIRAGTGEAEPSLFNGPSSLRQLHGQSKGETPVPPSNQNQAAPPPGAPRDYPAHTNDDLLSTPQPESSGRPAARAKAQGKQRGPSVDTIQEEEDEQDDPFETDTRPVDKGKRKAIKSALPTAKRTRLPTPSAAPAAESVTIQDYPPPSDPSQADLQRVRAEKELISQRARLAQTHGFKQRYAWSDNDTATLISLVRERHAAWATIQNTDNHRFEHPRNQQAYRDKARNLKVDYLMTDANLPPGFDLVALGKKEIDRLKGLGKNPWRKEEDIDSEGKPIGVDHEDGFHDRD
ncbi:Fc.00g041000.m01.CDS01 [Cosmosporella sp. VM-42]